MKIFGVDFTSAPKSKKPITAAHGHIDGNVLSIDRIEPLASFEAFEEFLHRPGPWIAGFDFPFGLPRKAVEDLGWPAQWRELVQSCTRLGKPEFKRQLDRYREPRLPGSRYATRRGDAVSGAHPAVKLVNPPVGLMFFEGAPRLAAAGLELPCLAHGDPSRVALEAYPGFLVKRQLGIKDSYKNDQRSQQTVARRSVRMRILGALQNGEPHGIRVTLANGLQQQLIDDGTGDSLDSVICAVQASWGQNRGAPRYGLPPEADPIEGWIVSA